MRDAGSKKTYKICLLPKRNPMPYMSVDAEREVTYLRRVTLEQLVNLRNSAMIGVLVESRYGDETGSVNDTRNAVVHRSKRM